MSPSHLRRVAARALLAGAALVVLLAASAVAAQDVSPQAVIPVGIQQGTWYEQWSTPGTLYCPTNRQRSVTATNEPFILSAPPGEATLTIAYQTSRQRVTFARSSAGSYVATNVDGGWVHLLEAYRQTPTQITLLSTFYAEDGSCTLTNQATWTYSTPDPQTACSVTPISVAVNKRSGPGVTFPVVGQLPPLANAAVDSAAYDARGVRWWHLTDNTWVSSLYTRAQGVCPG